MSQLSYSRDRAVAVPGMMSKDAGSFVVSYPAAEAIPPGRLVVLNSSGAVELPQDTTFAKPVGVSVFSPTNQQTAIPAAGFTYAVGDMVPCLRRGRAYVEYSGGSPAALTQANVHHSSTVATHRGKLTASATSAGAGTEISEPGPVNFVEAGPSGMWLAEVAFPGQSIEASARLDALEADAATANASFYVPLTSFVDPDGDPLVKFAADNVGTVGYTLADSEAMCLRWNNYPSNPGVIAKAQVGIPYDLDKGADIIVELLASKSGATVGDATAFVVGAYFLTAGDLHDADTLVTGDSTALVGNAAAKTTAKLTKTIGAADVPADAMSMTLLLNPKTGLIETDDVMVHCVRIRYTRSIQSS